MLLPGGKTPLQNGVRWGGLSWVRLGLSTSSSRQSGFTLPKAKRMEPQSQDLMARFSRAHRPFSWGLTRWGRGLGAHLDVPVVRRGLVKLLAQLEADLCVLEGALGLHCDLVARHLDDGGGFGEAGHLPGGEAHPCGVQGGGELRVRGGAGCGCQPLVPTGITPELFLPVTVGGEPQNCSPLVVLGGFMCAHHAWGGLQGRTGEGGLGTLPLLGDGS